MSAPTAATPNPVGHDSRGPDSTDLVLAGPILRRVEARRVVLWLASTRPLRARIVLHPDGGGEIRPAGAADAAGRAQCRSLRAGDHLHYLLLDFAQLNALVLQGRDSQSQVCA
ncbi:MAG: hypothetical protein QMC09_08765, partial [Thauera sp.]